MSEMQSSEGNTISPPAGQLQEAAALAGRGEYTASLQQIKSVKSVQPENIYVLAFERQVEQLIELTDAGAMTEEHRQDILESIPGIVERAIEQPHTRPSDMNAPERRVPGISTEERNAALSWLKNQYFQHAHEYVQKGQFSHALTEIQRIFIIEPENSSARDFEKKIHKLLGMAQPGTGPAASDAAAGKDSNIWLIAAAAVFVLVTILVIYFLIK